MPDDAMAPVNDIVAKIRTDAEAQHTIPGPKGKPMAMGDVAESAMRSSESLAKFLEDASVEGDNGIRSIPVKRLREVRQYWDEIAAQGKRYQGADLSEASKAETYGRVADAIRSEFAKADPNLAALNKEYSFWKNAEKVVTETVLRREGQAVPLSRQMGELGGTMIGSTSGPVGSILGKYGMRLFGQVTGSTGWKTANAVMKDRLANAIAGGKQGVAIRTLEDLRKTTSAASDSAPQTPLALGETR